MRLLSWGSVRSLRIRTMVRLLPEPWVCQTMPPRRSCSPSCTRVLPVRTRSTLTRPSAPPTPPQVVSEPSTTSSDAARNLTTGTLPSLMMESYTRSTTIDTFDLLARLLENARTIQAGDLAQIESMLISQAVALQSMFADLAVRGKRQTSVAAVQSLTPLALRAQAGSRATLQTLSEMKNLRQVAFVKQANVAQTQQVEDATGALRQAAKRSHAFRNTIKALLRSSRAVQLHWPTPSCRPCLQLPAP
jgi:hypothetical protein